MIFREEMSASGLLKTLSTSNLSLNLLTSPASGIDCSCLEITVLTGILDHLSEPFSAVEDCEFAVGESLSKITMSVSNDTRIFEINTYPMTPIEDLMRASLLFASK